MLSNTKKVFQLNAQERQVIRDQVSAEYGSMAFRYARAVYNEARTVESVPQSLKSPVQEVLSFVKQAGYDFIFE